MSDGYPPAAVHRMLLELAGRAPDDLLAQARLWLADGANGDLARSVAFAALARRFVVTTAESDRLAAMLTAAGFDASMIENIPTVSVVPTAPYLFVRSLSTGDDMPEVPVPDRVDLAVLEAIGGAKAVAGVSRAWRIPADGSPWPPPRRVYLVELREADVARGVSPARCAARLQVALTGVGETDPQVEVFASGEALPRYHRSALASAVPLRSVRPARANPLARPARTAAAAPSAAAPNPAALPRAARPSAPPPPRIAAMFDDIDPTFGPYFSSSHRVIEDDDREDLLAYLDAGVPAFATFARMDDVVDKGRPAAVPMTFRTDGVWIWSDATAYYLREYGLAPDEALVDHIAGGGVGVPAADAVRTARDALLDAPDGEPVWAWP